MGHLYSAPLELALAQVRFSPVFTIEEPSRLAEFQRRLGDRYLLEPPSSEGRPGAESVLLFHDRERSWTVSLTSNTIGLEAQTYHDFADFERELARVLGEATEVFEIRTETRLGVRYVNRIRDERLGKRGIQFFVRPELVSPIGTELGEDLSYSLSHLQFRERGTWLSLRHGLIETDVYLLDFDNFVEEERAFDPSRIVEGVGELHALIERLFVWALSPRYLRELQRAGA